MRIALIVALVIVAIVVMVSVMLQPSKQNGLQGFVGGGPSDSFFSKNKTKTYEAALARVTAVSAVIFALLVVALNLVK